MQPLMPPPPPPMVGAPPPPQQLPPAPSPPPVQPNMAPRGVPMVVPSSNLPRPVGDETMEAFMKFNPYKLTIIEMFYLGLIVVGGLIWIAQISQEQNPFIALLWVIIVYVTAMFWGVLMGGVSWRTIAKWSVKGWLLNVWRSPLFPVFTADACMIRIDSFVIEHRPSGLWNNIVFSIKQSWTSSLLLFTLLFLLMPDDITDLSTYYGIAIFLLLLSPILSGVLVPLYIFSDSSVVEVIPGKRDFAPIGMSLRQLLSRLIGWGSIVIVLFTVIKMSYSSGLSSAVQFLLTETLTLLSILGAMVLAAALSYPNRLHLKWVEEFNKLWFEDRDPDHTFHRIDDNAYIVIPDHLLHETLTHLRSVMGDNFSNSPIPKAPSIEQDNVQNHPPPPILRL